MAMVIGYRCRDGEHRARRIPVKGGDLGRQHLKREKKTLGTVRTSRGKWSTRQWVINRQFIRASILEEKDTVGRPSPGRGMLRLLRGEKRGSLFISGAPSKSEKNDKRSSGQHRERESA